MRGRLNLSTGLPAGKVNRSALTTAALRQAQDTAARALPYLLVIIAFALRIYRITYQSIWWDEAYSVHFARQDGRLIGQHDGLPAGGMRPTTSWVPGEVITDAHDMEFSDLGYRGRALIEVGLYESFTIERVPTEKGSDHLILPSEVVVKGER